MGSVAVGGGSLVGRLVIEGIRGVSSGDEEEADESMVEVADVSIEVRSAVVVGKKVLVTGAGVFKKVVVCVFEDKMLVSVDVNVEESTIVEDVPKAVELVNNVVELEASGDVTEVNCSVLDSATVEELWRSLVFIDVSGAAVVFDSEVDCREVGEVELLSGADVTLGASNERMSVELKLELDTNVEELVSEDASVDKTTDVSSVDDIVFEVNTKDVDDVVLLSNDASVLVVSEMRVVWITSDDVWVEESGVAKIVVSVTIVGSSDESVIAVLRTGSVVRVASVGSTFSVVPAAGGVVASVGNRSMGVGSMGIMVTSSFALKTSVLCFCRGILSNG